MQSARTTAILIIIALVAACTDPTPPASTELNDRIGGVRRQVWANESLLSSGRTEDHLPHLEATLSNIAARSGERSVAMVQALTETGVLLISTSNRYDLALPFIQRSLAVSRDVYGAEHRETAYALHDLAAVYADVDLSRYGPEAEALLREALRIRRNLLGADHEETAGAESELARQLLHRSRELEPNDPDLLLVEELALHARSVLEPLRGETNHEIVALRRTLLECAIARKDYALAEARAREAMKLDDSAPQSGLFPGATAEELLRTRIGDDKRSRD